MSFQDKLLTEAVTLREELAHDRAVQECMKIVGSKILQADGSWTPKYDHEGMLREMSKMIHHSGKLPSWFDLPKKK